MTDKKRTLSSLRKEREVWYDSKFRDAFNLFQDHFEDQRVNSQIRNQILIGIHDKSDLNQYFFSDKNINRIQFMLKEEIFKQSNGRFQIDRQSDSELVQVMKSVYLRYARNLPYQIAEQVAQLNRIVIREIVPYVLSEIYGYYGYLRDIQRTPTPIDRPKSLSSKGLKTLIGPGGRLDL